MRRSRVYNYKDEEDEEANSPPSSFGLISPPDGAEVKTVLMFDWEDSEDPDGLTYNLIIATDSAFDDIVYRKEEIPISAALVDKSVGLEDLMTFYW